MKKRYRFHIDPVDIVAVNEEDAEDLFWERCMGCSLSIDIEEVTGAPSRFTNSSYAGRKRRVRT